MAWQAFPNYQVVFKVIDFVAIAWNFVAKILNYDESFGRIISLQETYPIYSTLYTKFNCFCLLYKSSATTLCESQIQYIYSNSQDGKT